MKKNLLQLNVCMAASNGHTAKAKTTFPGLMLLFLLCCSFAIQQVQAQGTWSTVTNICPAANAGVMLILSDGTVMCKTSAGGTDGIGNTWYRLKPDATGSYINGTWSPLNPMINTRLYFSSQVLKDGRVYVAGGEYGTGGSQGETYNPLTNTWTAAPPPGAFLSDANSAILPNGKVLQAMVTGNLKPNKIYDPVTNTYAAGPSCLGIHNESTWVKLPDESILQVDRNAVTSERYIPSLNQWVADANVPVSLYDPFGLETGAGLLLPDGRAFYIGSTGHTAYYTPSGSAAPGSWAAGPDFPNAQGAPDAPAAMMVNGKVLCTVSPAPTSANHFPSPTSFYEFDYLTNTFLRLNAPTGGLTYNAPCYVSNMVDLPDGKVLVSFQGSSTYYVYTPAGAAIAAGKPTLSTIKKVAGSKSYRITGKLFNGISEGACYGDDWQMASNYPLLRITAGANVFYARTFNWNSTGVMRGAAADTAFFTLPAGLTAGPYSISVVANGIASTPVVVPASAFSSNTPEIAITSAETAAAITAQVTDVKAAAVYPNPAKNQTNLQFTLAQSTHVAVKVYDMSGKENMTVVNSDLQQGYHSLPVNTSRLTSGLYMIRMITNTGVTNVKLVVQ
ncbi:T9SS type A sorting domain-containing protein [Limnovirga soli]|uniref:T9SS type A sorting domain-containing protein n=1 Tax=Limnovirga soli TaxID=2656915 RepID=A0A8J8FF79_9BACT|nr:T9SS type A sorting domain-containing protein [Limnovirga soli]NNV56818.1 T9SS type A sorting domain-containing protein [Limnovirga soli]